VFLKTFNEWKKLGCRIKKGSKSISRNKKGQCLFSSEQVYDLDAVAYSDYDYDDEFNYNESDWY
jgi:hypothetical protein